MFELEHTFYFEAGHVLKHHDGRCSNPHGHNFGLTVKIRSEKLISSGPKTNMVIDLYDVAAIVNPMITQFLDHKWLNDSLGHDSMTIEFMAKWIYDYLTPRLPGLYAVTVEETAKTRVTYIG